MDDNRDWVQELRNMVTDAEALLNAAGADGNEAARQVREKLTESIDRARATLEGLEDEASRYVRENPWQSLGLAAAIGLVAGLLVSGRR